MADVGFRDMIGSIAPGRREEPTIAPQTREDSPPASPVPPGPAPEPAPPTPFGATPDLGDSLGLDPTLGRIAELVAHRGTATPLAVGILGAPGSGRSFALDRTLARLRTLAAAAGKAPASPFLSRLHVEAIDAASLDGDPAMAIAARLHAGLRGPYPDLAREIGHTARDPHVVLRETNDKLDEARRRLDSERRALDDVGSRRARLVETVLYEAAGSQVDAYARANRAGIESRFASFGIAGDPIRNYKDFVQYLAGSGGKVGLAVRALWAYKGQGKLLVAAVLLIALGIGLGIATDDQASWLGQLRAGPQAGAGIANWMQAHIGLLATARSAAFVLAALAVLANLWRAFSFLKPIFRGAHLLEGDLDSRRRDLDGLYAHQTKRVDALDGDVERLTRDVAEAERRAGGSGPSRSEPSPFEPAFGSNQAKAVFAALTKAMAGAGKGPTAPQRIALALDHLDAVPAERARAILDALHRAAGPGFVILAAAAPSRLDPSDEGLIERWIDVPVRLTAPGDGGAGALVSRLLGRGPTHARDMPVDAGSSALDEPVGLAEAQMLAAVAPLAGRSPRAVARFVGLYRMARLEGSAPGGALAAMVAVAQNGSGVDRATVERTLADGSGDFALPANASPRLRAAFEAAEVFDGCRLGAADASAAARQAGRFALRD